jgi:hypothetical protein
MAHKEELLVLQSLKYNKLYWTIKSKLTDILLESNKENNI